MKGPEQRGAARPVLTAVTPHKAPVTADGSPSQGPAKCHYRQDEEKANILHGIVVEECWCGNGGENDGGSHVVSRQLQAIARWILGL